jgi:hypothetical protein
MIILFKSLIHYLNNTYTTMGSVKKILDSIGHKFNHHYQKNKPIIPGNESSKWIRSSREGIISTWAKVKTLKFINVDNAGIKLIRNSYEPIVTKWTNIRRTILFMKYGIPMICLLSIGFWGYVKLKGNEQKIIIIHDNNKQ